MGKDLDGDPDVEDRFEKKQVVERYLSELHSSLAAARRSSKEWDEMMRDSFLPWKLMRLPQIETATV
jgi:hypothetical protein